MTGTGADGPLRRAAELGGYFSLAAAPAGDGWESLDALVHGPASIRLVDRSRSVLSQRSGGRAAIRVAASITFLGLAARLVSPALAAAAVDAQVLSPGALWWRPSEDELIPMAWTDVRTRPARDAADAARGLLDGGVGGTLESLADTFAARFVLSPKVLWGNVASALGGAAAAIAEAAPDSALDPFDILDVALGRGPLRGSAHLTRPAYRAAQPAGPVLVRHNCCLYYRIDGSRCGDCVLVHR